VYPTSFQAAAKKSRQKRLAETEALKKTQATLQHEVEKKRHERRCNYAHYVSSTFT